MGSPPGRPPARTPRPARPPRAAPAEVELMLRTAPSGADIYAGSEKIGVSPLQLKRPRGPTPLTFSFRHAGFKDAAREIVPEHDVEIEVLLVAKSSSKTASSKRPTTAS